MTSLIHVPSSISTVNCPRVCPRKLNLLKPSNFLQSLSFPRIHIKHSPVCCSKLTPWEPQPVTYAPTDESDKNFLNKSARLFEALSPENETEAIANQNKDITESSYEPIVQRLLFKWPMWLLGPALLLTTGMAPTLWLPLSSVFLGPNVASLLSLIGLDCIFNRGATLFLLMADSCARPYNAKYSCNSKAPFSYQFWNMFASLAGSVVPLLLLFGSGKGFIQPELSFISFSVLLGPYFLLLAVQMLTEMLTWHWQSPVWLLTPIVYGAYRILQLMRGLRLGAELSAPVWTMHTIRGLVSWWVLILGVQLMRVAWFAGFTTQKNQQPSVSAEG